MQSGYYYRKKGCIVCIVKRRATALRNVIKAKDTPWDAVLMGSVVCTVGAKVIYNIYIYNNMIYLFSIRIA
jgi:hypothetical protein